MSLRNVGAAKQRGPTYPESHQGHEVGLGETPGLGRIASLRFAKPRGDSLAMTPIARSDVRLGPAVQWAIPMVPALAMGRDPMAMWRTCGCDRLPAHFPIFVPCPPKPVPHLAHPAELLPDPLRPRGRGVRCDLLSILSFVAG